MPRKTILAISTLAVICTLSFFLLNKFLKVKEIICVADPGGCRIDTKQKLDNFKNTPVLPSIRQINNLLKEENTIAEYLVEFKPLSTIKVQLNYEPPTVVIVSTNFPDTFALVGDSGYVLEYSNLLFLPAVVTTSIPPNPGEKLDSKHLFASKLLKALNIAFSVNQVNVSNDGISAKIDEINVIFGNNGDETQLITSLQLLLSQVKIMSSQVREIDMRFENPVIRQL